LIDKIVVTGQDVDIYFKVTLEQFIKNMDKQLGSVRISEGSSTIDLKGLDKSIGKYIVLCSDRESHIDTDIDIIRDKQYIASYKDWYANHFHSILCLSRRERSGYKYEMATTFRHSF